MKNYRADSKQKNRKKNDVKRTKKESPVEYRRLNVMAYTRMRIMIFEKNQLLKQMLHGTNDQYMSGKYIDESVNEGVEAIKKKYGEIRRGILEEIDVMQDVKVSEKKKMFLEKMLDLDKKFFGEVDEYNLQASNDGKIIPIAMGFIDPPTFRIDENGNKTYIGSVNNEERKVFTDWFASKGFNLN